MRQPALSFAAPTRVQATSSAQAPATRTQLEVYDLFCGAGGFSTGAEAAGAIVAYGADADADAIATFRANHAGARAEQRTLPCNELPFPRDGRCFHVHASPPCQAFSVINNASSPEKRKNGLALVEWALDVALTCGCTTWSLEQVDSADVIALLQRYRQKWHSQMAFAVFDFAHLGVPQRRRRVIAGSPSIVAGLLRDVSSGIPHRGVCDVIARPRGQFVRGPTTSIRIRKRRAFELGPPAGGGGTPDNTVVWERSTWTDHCRPLTEPAFTVVAGRALNWVTVRNDGEVEHATFTVAEGARLQTFPEHYEWPPKATLARRLIGNAVPCDVGRRIIMHAQSAASIAC